MKFFLRFFCVISCFFLLNSCKSSRQKADLIVTNAKVYTVDTAFSVTEAFAVKDGKIIETGTSQFISETFDADTVIDAQGKIIFPGFIDAHCHFYNYGMGLNEVNLVGTNSFEEVLERVKNFSASHPAVKNDPRSEWIIGRGWDQNDWKNNQFPDRAKLDELFPDRPVLLTRIDGHAALANKTALKRAGIHYGSSIGGGKIEFRENFDQEDWSDPLMKVETGKLNFRGKSPSGILIDNAVKLVEDLIPMPSREAKEKALMAAQRDCFENGLTTIDDAGLDKEIILLIDSLQKAGQLQMRIYAMISSTQNNFDYFLHRPKIKTQYLNVRSFKFYADGALGSRGACLKEDYQDKKNWKGFLLQQAEYFRLHAAKMFENGFQMNTHCIGDSSDYVIGTIYRNQINPTGKDEDALKKYRWRIEHAQIVSASDRIIFKSVIPSVQPTHATSDMYWAEERLGAERIGNAYAYQTLLKNAGTIALGTDFPVEGISPINTFYAAVFRKDKKGYPENGFQLSDALTREQAIRGMTIWAAFANFEENEKGSIEKGKLADFVILDNDLMMSSEGKILDTKVLSTFIGGKIVYQRK